MDTNGHQIVRTSGKLADRSDREYFKKAISGEVYTSDPYIDSIKTLLAETVMEFEIRLSQSHWL